MIHVMQNSPWISSDPPRSALRPGLRQLLQRKGQQGPQPLLALTVDEEERCGNVVPRKMELLKWRFFSRYDSGLCDWLVKQHNWKHRAFISFELWSYSRVGRLGPVISVRKLLGSTLSFYWVKFTEIYRTQTQKRVKRPWNKSWQNHPQVS